MDRHIQEYFHFSSLCPCDEEMNTLHPSSGIPSGEEKAEMRRGEEEGDVLPDAIRRRVVLLIHFLPGQLSGMTKLNRTLNSIAMKEGTKPIGPDFKFDGLFAVRALLSALLEPPQEKREG